ncbi:MAG: Holliday junction resolvase RuvX [Actinobacteria bacterium]|nr:Holliday junction resolvase RuvX [Actinomycetota bacterium]
MRSLGLDIGERRVGVAVSDPLGVHAYPLETLHDIDPEALREYVSGKVAEGVREVVIGLPLTMRGREGAQAAVARRYAEALRALPSLEVILWDERLSTVEATRRLREGGKRRRRAGVDAEAASLVLQSYLDGKRKAERD